MSKETDSSQPMKRSFFQGKFSCCEWKTYGICAALGVLVFLVFGQTVHHEFVSYDDGGYVNENAVVLQGVTLSGIRHAFTHKELGLYNPLVTISHMLDSQIYGLNAGGHHLTNVLLHLTSVLLLFLILREMTGTLWRSAFVAAFFAIHPLRVESVAWIAERKDVLSGLFFMLTWGAYLYYVHRTGSRVRYGAVFFLFLLGLMCKPMLVTMPFVLLLLDYWPLNRLFLTGRDSSGEWAIDWRVVVEKIPLFVLSLGWCLLTMAGPPERDLNAVQMEKIPFSTRICEAPVSLAIYLGQMIWPTNLAVIYPHPKELGLLCPVAVVLLGALSLGTFLLRKRHPYLWMGWLWNLGMLVPVSGIVQISRHWRADHYTYLPQIGLYIGLIWTVADRVGKKKRLRLVWGGAALGMVAALALVARDQTSVWRESLSLYTHTLKCTKDNFITHNNLGAILLTQDKKEEAVLQFQEALRIEPRDEMARNNLGKALFLLGRTEEAISYFRETLRNNSASVDAHSNLGLALFQQGKQEEAMAHFREALRINPHYSEAHYNLGTVLLQQGKTEEAITQYREALRLKPNYVMAHNNLGNALIQQGRTEEAIVQFREALKFAPSHASANYNLATLLLQQGRSEEAVVHFNEALRINPSDADAWNGCGSALFRQGQAAEAIFHVRKALELQPTKMAAQNNLAWMLATASPVSLRNGDEAVQLAMSASQADGGNNASSLRILAAAYAEAGDFSNAVPTARRALQLAEAQTNADLSSKLHREIQLYEVNRSFREEP